MEQAARRPPEARLHRGELGSEDTRQALFEARADGIQPFWVKIDERAVDYLPHRYGAPNYAVVADVSRLPIRVSDIYRTLSQLIRSPSVSSA